MLASDLCTRANEKYAKMTPDLCTRAISINSSPDLCTRELIGTGFRYPCQKKKSYIGAGFMHPRLGSGRLPDLRTRKLVSTKSG